SPAGRQWLLVNAEDAEELFDPATARQPGRHRNEQTAAQAAQRSDGQGGRASGRTTLSTRRTWIPDHSTLGVGSTACDAEFGSAGWQQQIEERRRPACDKISVGGKVMSANSDLSGHAFEQQTPAALLSMSHAPIQQNPEKLSGHPTISAKRVPADVLINYLANGQT